LDAFTINDNGNIDLATWQSMSSQDAHSFTATPAALFVDPNNGDFHLLSSSPAIDKGSPVHAPAYDIEAHARPVGPAFDIGAYEYCSGNTCMQADGGSPPPDGGGGSSSGSGGGSGSSNGGGSSSSSGAGGSSSGGKSGSSGSGSGGQASSGGSGAGNNGDMPGASSGSSGGCGCATAGEDSRAPLLAVFLVAAPIWLLKRRRR
jgi:MYXO-CTERM domain-containing protein